MDRCKGHPGWRPDNMPDCIADLMASNGASPCPVCGLPRKVLTRAGDGTHTATGSVTGNGALD